MTAVIPSSIIERLRIGFQARAMVKLNKIYTRTGDGGTTGLVDGSRIAKSAPLLAAVGDVDEANSAFGLAVAALPADRGEAASPARIHKQLFDLGAGPANRADAAHGLCPLDRQHQNVTA